MDQNEAAEQESDGRSRVKLRRYTLTRPSGAEERPADIERVFDTYGVRNFKYRTWGRWAGGLPATATRAGVSASTEEGMANKSSGSSRGGPYAWEMPEDLKMGVLPLLNRMPDTTALVAKLKLGGNAPRRGPTTGLEGSPAATPATVSSVADAAVEEQEVEVTDEIPQSAKPASDARSRLRQLALKGQTNG